MAFAFSSFASRQIIRPFHGQFRQLSPSYSIGLASKAPARFQHSLNRLPTSILQNVKENGLNGRRWLMKGATVATVGIGLASLSRPPVQCETPPGAFPTSPSWTGDSPPPPSSSISLYELGFGTVAGICAGVFVKKGAKALAWFLGGIFVLLQYMGSVSVTRVDWGRVARKFENLFYTKDATGASKPPNVGSSWNWMVNFLTADFPPRASFLAGFVLGLRVG